MTVDGKSVPLETPAQTIDGHTVLPLRAIAEAMGQQVSWLGDLIVCSPQPFAETSAATKQTLSQIRHLLTETSTDPKIKNSPIAAYNGGIYSLKPTDSTWTNWQLFCQKDGATKIIPLMPSTEIGWEYFKGSYYYPVKQNDKIDLYRQDFDTNQNSKVCSLSTPPAEWTRDGWFSNMLQLRDHLYVVLHYGDNTMGAEELFRIDDGKLYYTDLGMWGNQENLYCLNLATPGAEPQLIAKPGYVYDINISQDGGTFISLNNEDLRLAPQKNSVYLNAREVVSETEVAKQDQFVCKLNLQDNS